jgi:hypothetical protein
MPRGFALPYRHDFRGQPHRLYNISPSPYFYALYGNSKLPALMDFSNKFFLLKLEDELTHIKSHRSGKVIPAEGWSLTHIR